MKTAVTNADMEKVLATIVKQIPWALDAKNSSPKIVMDFDYFGRGSTPAIVWEEGPFEWTYTFPYGGIDGEFGFSVADVSGYIPEGLFIEPITSWAVGVYVSD
jgi:hypothetical protein